MTDRQDALDAANEGVWAVVLAAGNAKRMGRPKQLLPLANGLPLLRSVVLQALASDVAGVVVVLSQREGEVAAVLSGLPVQIAINPDANSGQSTSLHVGVLQLRERSATAGLFLLGDQPDISTFIMNQVLTQFRQTQASLVQARYRGQGGHPVVFASSLYDALLQCTGDEGGRSVVKAHRHEMVVVDLDMQYPVDLDTPDDYRAYLLRGDA